MNAQNGNTAPKGLPPRSGMRRLINPMAYRHLRGFGVGHITGGSVQAAAGLICHMLTERSKSAEHRCIADARGGNARLGAPKRR